MVTLGKIKDKVLQPGLHFKAPFITSVAKVSIEPTTVKLAIPVNDNGAITRDNQIIGGDMVYFYRFTDTRIIDMMSQFGVRKIEELSVAALTEAFKTAIGKYTIFDVAVSQEKIRQETFNYMLKKMDGYPVEPTDLVINNYNWSGNLISRSPLQCREHRKLNRKNRNY